MADFHSLQLAKKMRIIMKKTKQKTHVFADKKIEQIEIDQKQPGYIFPFKYCVEELGKQIAYFLLGIAK